MQSSTVRYGWDLQYAIIGRLKREHDAYGLDPEKIKGIIAVELMPFVDESDIKYVAPNFIICLDCPQAQQNILAAKTLATHRFQLQMVAWSYEHEWRYLPWITVPMIEGSTILINPLDILPVVPKIKGSQGTEILKDKFAATIPRQYDLRAPDLSYLLITELRDFYKAKFAAFIKCKKMAANIHETLHHFFVKADDLLKETHACIQSLQPPYAADAFINSLKTAIRSTDMPLTQLDNLTKSALDYKDLPLNLESFVEGPPTNEILVPVQYADRLKVIYCIAIQQIHRTTPIIETIQRAKNRYEIYITVAGFTRRYHGSHTASGPAMEAAALFYALKHLTNVQGYKIIDLNYPILHKLVSDVEAWNLWINKFQLYSTIALRQVEKICNSLIVRCKPTELSQIGVQNSKYLIHVVTAMVDALENICMSMSQLCESLSKSKAAYHGIHVGIYSPTGSVYRWALASRPTSA